MVGILLHDPEQARPVHRGTVPSSFNPLALGIELRFDGEALPMPFAIILCARHLDFIGWIRGGIAVLDA